MADVEARFREVLKSLARPASRLEVGGFRPPEAPDATWIGRVRVAAPGEGWPEHDGAPMVPIAQLDVTDAPLVHEVLADVGHVMVFVPSGIAHCGPTTQGALVREYPRGAELVEIDAPAFESPLAPFPGRWHAVDVDYPSWDDLVDLLPPDLDAGDDEVFEAYDELREAHRTAEGTKLGGWPFTVQSEVRFDGGVVDAPDLTFAFQLDSEPKAKLNWVDRGVAYFARSRTRPDAWAHACQFL